MAVQTSSSSFVSSIVNIMENFWLAKRGLSKLSRKEEEDKINTTTQRIALHLAQFTLHFSDISSIPPVILQLEGLLALKKWSQLTKLCQLIEKSHFLLLSDAQVRDLLLKEGLCVGIVIYYFSEFFKKRVPLLSSPFPLGTVLQVDPKDKVKFYPFQLDQQATEARTRCLRFLQATYKVAYAFKGNHTTELISAKILEGIDLKLTRRIPLESKKIAFKMEDLIPKLKQLAYRKDGYLLGISNGSTSHALALYLDTPFHFVDPNQGIAIAQSLEELLLFLANYLTEKYPNYHHFALLEFTSLKEYSLNG